MILTALARLVAAPVGRRARILAILGVLACAPFVALLVAAAMTRLPPALLEARSSTGVVFSDRDGVVIKETRADDGERARWVPLAEVSPDLVHALLAAEDRRFFQHAGVDPVAAVRAVAQLALHRRVVSGASTLTQQLARTVAPRRRSAFGKLQEMALALRIEWSLSKSEILEQYLNRVEFGPGLRGVEAASRYYFDAPTRSISLAEAAALAGMPRGPTLYDPRRSIDRLKRRRDRVLGRMQRAGLEGEDRVARAVAEPIVIAKKGSSLGAPHLVREVLRGDLDEGLGALQGRASRVTLTIDRGLQREAEVLARATVASLASRKVSAASVVVIENATGELLAYVGSPDFDDAVHLGQNDGVLARRQPGSSLKPFVYELAMEKLGFTAATTLPDVDLYFPMAGGGDYHPNNYDGHLHGPVRLREALANSFNIPAVWTADAVGPGSIVERLGALGVRGLDPDGSQYGAAIALGDAEVRLLDLANAYATLARGGLYLPSRAVRAAEDATGHALDLPKKEASRVLDEADAFVVTDILADKNARLASFGEGNVLELPFPCAAKTGTSKGYRDNITAGYTKAVTVAVWVGNFDGSPMEGVSGVTGAGPLFHDVMLAAARRFPGEPFAAPADRIEEAEVCSLSGELPEEHCSHRRHEVFARHDGKSSVPKTHCSAHVDVWVDPDNGLLAGDACPTKERRTFERYDGKLLAWAEAAHRPLAPKTFSPRCPGRREADPLRRASPVRVAFPPDGATFALDPSAASRQAITLRAEAPAGSRVRFVIDGVAREVKEPFELSLPLALGVHHVRAEADGKGSEEIEFSVE